MFLKMSQKFSQKIFAIGGYGNALNADDQTEDQCALSTFRDDLF